MKYIKKIVSLVLSFLTATILIAPISKADGNDENLTDPLISDKVKKYEITPQVLVLETPGTDANKFLKRFFDKNALYYEKDVQGKSTGVINHNSLEHPKKFEMMKISLDTVSNWENYPNREFYEKIDNHTFYFECKLYEESSNMGKELTVYETTFKVFKINSIDDLCDSELIEEIKKSSSIFEMFDLKNKEGFFTIDNVKGIIDRIKSIDFKHYDMPVLDNCEMGQTDFQIQMPEFEHYFIDKCCTFILFNHNSGQGTFMACLNFLSRGGRLYKKKQGKAVFSCKQFMQKNKGYIIAGSLFLVGAGLCIYYGAPALCECIKKVF